MDVPWSAPFQPSPPWADVSPPGVGEAVSSPVHHRVESLSWQLADSLATVDQLGNEEEEDESADRAAFVTSLGDNKEERRERGWRLDHTINKDGGL